MASGKLKPKRAMPQTKGEWPIETELPDAANKGDKRIETETPYAPNKGDRWLETDRCSATDKAKVPMKPIDGVP